MVKVYFSYGLYPGCNYVRMFLPQRAGGWEGDWKDIEKRIDKKEAVQKILNSDIVIIHRPLIYSQLEIIKIARALGKKIVVDNDDTYKDLVGLKGWMKKYGYQIDNVLEAVIKNVDLATVSTEFLKKEYEKINPNVVVLPNCVDERDWPIPEEYENKKFRVGIIGSVSYDDFRVCYEDLRKLGEEKDIQLVVTRDKKDANSKLWHQINHQSYNYFKLKDYFQKLKDLKLDLMIIPREDNYFNRCKSNVKFLEASMLEIPVLAQSFNDGTSPYEVNKKDTEHLILVKNNWYEAVMEAKQNRDYLKKMAKEARKYVLENYNINKKIALWKLAYLKI